MKHTFKIHFRLDLYVICYILCNIMVTTVMSIKSPHISSLNDFIIFCLGNKCFHIGVQYSNSGMTYEKARNYCLHQRGIGPDLASFDNELENGMRFVIVIIPAKTCE